MKKPESLKAWCLLGAVSCLSACTDLNVPQANEPDSERVLSNSGDVVPLFAGSFNTWFNGVYAAQGPYAVLNNMTFQNNGPWANNGADLYGRIPRVGVINDIAAHYYSNIVRVWYWAYRANASVSDGFRALSNPTISEDFSTEELAQLRAYGKFVQGMAHATVALFYDRGFIIDETTDPGLPHEPVDYPELMEAAFRKFDEAIDVAETSEFTLPFSWMQADLSSRDLVRVINSYKARFRSQVARTKEERGSLDWSAVLNDVETGIQSDFEISMDWNAGWYNQALDFTPYTSGNSFTYFMYGMSDQGGNVAEWLDLNLAEKSSLLPDGRPVLIVTPDLRFPQGVTVEEQRAAPGTYFRIMDPDEVGNTWKAPQRGTWRWSWYKAGHEKFQSYWLLEKFDQPEILLVEMRLLKAEALIHLGDPAGAAAIINETRTASGLSPTDAAGSNTSCVPRLPNVSCGDLWEMLKWEKRMEGVLTGVAGGNWFFDGRGWGDLWKDTPLHFPIPCQELQVLQIMPCNHVGGPGGEMGSPGSTYRFPGEG